MSIPPDLMALRAQILGIESSIQSSKHATLGEACLNLDNRKKAIVNRLESLAKVSDPFRGSFDELKSLWDVVEGDFSGDKVIDEGLKGEVRDLAQKVQALYKIVTELSASDAGAPLAAAAAPSAFEDYDAVEDIITDAVLRGRWDAFSRDNPKTVKAIGSMLIRLKEGAYGDRLSAALEESDPNVISQESIWRLTLFDIAHREEVDENLPEPLMAFKTSSLEAFSALIKDLKDKDNDFLGKVIFGVPPLTPEETEIATALNRILAKLEFGREAYQTLLSNLQPIMIGPFAPTGDSVTLLIRAGLLDNAMALADSISDPLEYVDAHMNLAFHYAMEVGDDAQALRMLQKASSINAASASLVAGLISSRLSMNDPLRSILYAAQISHPSDRAEKMGPAVIYIELEEIDRIIWYVDEFKLYDQVPRMVEACISMGKTEKGLTLLEQYWDRLPFSESDRLRLVSSIFIMEKMDEGSSVIGNLEVWRKITKIVGKLKDGSVSVKLWDSCCVKMTRILQSKDDVDEAMGYLKQVYDEKLKVNELRRFMEGVLHKGTIHSSKVDFGKAFSIANVLAPGAERDSFFGEIAHVAMMDYGDEEQAKRAAREITDGSVARYVIDKKIQSCFHPGPEPEELEMMEALSEPPPAEEPAGGGRARRGIESLKEKFKKLPLPHWRR